MTQLRHNRVGKVESSSDQYGVIIFDGSPDSDVQTLEVSRMSDLVVLPTGFSRDDMSPAIKLAY